MFNEHKTKVLIVADKPPPQSLQDLLKNRNCSLVVSSKQDEALSLLQTDVFHIVFIDCILSSGEGTSLIKPIRKALGLSVEIILTSKLFKESDLAEFINTDKCFYLQKPFSTSKALTLLNRIQRKKSHKGDILSRMFSSVALQDIDRCKWLISLKKVSGVELFIHLNSALISKEFCQISFRETEEKTGGLIHCRQGAITNFSLYSSHAFLNELLAKKAISPEIAKQLSPFSQKECERKLLENCHLDPSMLSSIIKNILLSRLKKISLQEEIPFSADILKTSKETLPPLFSINRENFCDLIFHFLPESASLSSLFNKKEMNQSLILNKELLKKPDCPNSIKALAEKLLSGKSLHTISLDFHESNLREFYSQILYLLLKGEAKLPETSLLDTKYQNLYERYNSLYHFACETQKEPSKFFTHLQGFPKSQKIKKQELNEIYLNFVKNNHPDKIKSNKKISALIEKTYLKVKDLYENLTSELNSKTAKEINEEGRWIALKKGQILTKYIQEKKYKQAMDVIKALSNEEHKKHSLYKLYYLWIHFEAKELKLSSEEEARECMRFIQSKANIFVKEKLYNFTLGLYHENKQNYKQAKLFFHNAKAIDPSFKPTYSAINRCNIKLIQQSKQDSSGSFSASLEKLLKKLNKKIG